MKIATSYIPGVIPIDDDRFTSLIIENGNVFRNLTMALQNAVNDAVDEVTISINEDIVTPSKALDIILTPIPFSLNRKNLLSALAKRLETVAIRPERTQETQEALTTVRDWLKGLLLEIPHEVELSGLSASALIKAGGLAFDEDNVQGLERLLAYMRLIREFDRERAFVFYHLRAYFDDEELGEFIHVALEEKFQMLWIDDFAKSLLRDERRIIIDKDQCRIDEQEDDPLYTDIRIW